MRQVSIVITAHQEGIVAHKTVLSLLRAAEELTKNKIDYEIVVGLDNPDTATKDYYKRWDDDERFRIIEGSFGNPADNRNNSIQFASGKYIALIDGDDLLSRNMLIESYNLLQTTEQPAVLHPEAHIQFGFYEHENAVWLMSDSRSKQEDAIQMAYWNKWTGMYFAERNMFLKFPFKAAGNGFGFEDYLFNCDTRSAGVQHLVVPGTVIFYRRRLGSTSSLHTGTILDYSTLFSTEYIRSIKLNGQNITKTRVLNRIQALFKSTYRFIYDAAKQTPIIKKAISPVARKILHKKNSQKLPEFIIHHWRDMNGIENQLYPTRGSIAQIQFHPLSFNQYNDQAGRVYVKLIQQTKRDPDYLFLAPEMSGRGGTEKLMMNYISAIQKAHPNWKIAILSTVPFNEATTKYFPESVDMIDFGKMTAGMSDYEKDIVWSRILIQTKVKRLHLVNDEYWYRWMARHMTLLKNNDYIINVSLFMREYTHERDRIQTFADPCLSEIWPLVNKVFTDNRNVIDEALQNNAFDSEKFVVHYQPESLINQLVPPKIINANSPLRILWASRVSYQKRPDVLKAITTKLEKADYTVDAYGFLQQYKKNYFANSNVNYKGGFSGGIKSIRTFDYDVYLYTSDTDGIPNILLEVAAAGLPVVASNVGGIKEFIHNKETGLLVDSENIDGYVEALQYLKQHPNIAEKYAKAAQSLLLKQHSVKNFEKSIREDIK